MNEEVNSINFYSNIDDKVDEIISKVKITNDMLFSSVLTSDNELICDFISMVTDISDIDTRDITTLSRECTIKVDMKSKGIRLDIYVMTNNHILDIEMQNKEQKYLPKRMRYYQDVIDVDYLKSGMKYSELKELYIIFLCNFNPCSGLGDTPVIKIKNFYHDSFNNGGMINYNDGVHKILINLQCSTDKISDNSLKSFIEFMQDGYNVKTKTPFVNKMKNIMESIKRNPDWRREYMTSQEERELYKESGIYKAIRMLLKYNVPDNNIVKEICLEYDISLDKSKKYLDEVKEYTK